MDRREGSEGAGLGTLLVAEGVAGIAGWIFTFPMDVVKTRVQGHDGGYYLSSPSTTAVGTSAPTAISSFGWPRTSSFTSATTVSVSTSIFLSFNFFILHPFSVAKETSKPVPDDPIHPHPLLPHRRTRGVLAWAWSYVTESRTSAYGYVGVSKGVVWLVA
ncbi:hypothetical protein PQX77_012455 [Marasmius sp. AFHP31]|nr:hypothetical protein PQX77_012455 [Marasmius sp. AFHP31]